MGISAAWWDYDEDGYPDLYVANDFEHADRLYRNRGDGTFENEIRYVVPHSAYSAMGSAIADLDGNGHLDLFVLDMASTTHFKEKVNMGEMGGIQQYVMDFSEPRQIMRNVLYLNTGMGRMMEGALLAGLGEELGHLVLGQAHELGQQVGQCARGRFLGQVNLVLGALFGGIEKGAAQLFVVVGRG